MTKTRKGNADFLSLTNIYGGRAHYKPGDSLGPRLLTDYELVLIIEGDVLYTANGKDHKLSPGSAIIGLPGTEQLFLWDTKKPTYHVYIHFSIDQVPGDWASTEDWPSVIPEPDPIARPMFRHVLRHLAEHEDWSVTPPDRAESRLVETLIDVLLESHAQDEADFHRNCPAQVYTALRNMKLSLEETPVKKYTLTQLAKESHVTEKHLCRLFSNSIGHSPMQTYNLLRLQYALTLLARSNLNVTQVAARCGFDNPLYFTRAFSKTFGKAPTQLRKDILTGEKPPSSPLPIDIMPRMFW